ncbi:MAG: choice-of-anchor J domain-containing protein, partial [Caldilineae bacterium]|nr:choice-of-anchor J domain-containing protein [Caldilineae bacterium]
GQGWFFQNNSEPLGVTDWFQGNDGVFPSQAGATTAYIAANFNNSGSPGTISNWMLTPEMSMSDGDTLSFWTRTVTGSTFPDRLQVRLSTAGSSTNVGVGANDVGDFTTLLLDINPSLLQGGYPDDWAQYTITLSGLPGGMADGRVAWRYFVTDAGPTGANSNYIGIDTVEYVAGMAEPCTALADIPWLSVSPANGSNGGGTNTNVTATFDSTGLADGVYTGNLCITSNDPDAGPGNGTDLVIVPVTLTVRPPTAVVVTNLAAESADLPAGGTAAAVSAFLAALLTVVVVSYRQRRQRR